MAITGAVRGNHFLAGVFPLISAVALTEQIKAHRDHIGAALLAATLTVGYSYDSFVSWQFSLWPVLFGLSCLFIFLEHRTLSKWETRALGIILGSMLLAIAGSVLWGQGAWVETLMLLIWTGPVVAFFAVKRPQLVLWWMVPPLLCHAGVLFYQGFWLGETRAVGLSMNPNPAAALLFLGALFLVSQPKGKAWWLVLPLLMALPYTGSRWTLVVLVVCLGLMFLTRWGRWRSLLQAGALLLSFGVAWMVHDGLLLRNFRVSPTVPEHIYRASTDVQKRLELGSPTESTEPTLLALVAGRGLIKTDGLHNVPLRMATQFGVLAAGAWIWLVAAALWRRPRLSSRWWLALAVLLLAQMDY
jgi:hypothetical protein